MLKRSKLIFSVFIILVDCLLKRLCWAGIREVWAYASHRSLSWCCCCHLSPCWWFGAFFSSSVLQLRFLSQCDCHFTILSFFTCFTALSPLCSSLSPGDAAGLYQSRFSWVLTPEHVSQGAGRAAVTLVYAVLCCLFARRSVWHSLGAWWGHGSTVWLYSDLQRLEEHWVPCLCTELPFSLTSKPVTDVLTTVLLCTDFMWEITELLMDINWGFIMSWVSVSRE